VGADSSDNADNGTTPIPDSPLPENPDLEPIQALELVPESHDFGLVGVGQFSVARVFTVTNTGSGEVRITAVSLAGPNPLDFSIVVDGCSRRTLTPLAVCTVTVQFVPQAPGPRSAVLQFVPQDPTIDAPTAQLTGQGLFF